MTIEVNLNIKAAELAEAIERLAEAMRQGGATTPAAEPEAPAPAAEPELEKPKRKRGRPAAAEAPTEPEPAPAEPEQPEPEPEQPAEAPVALSMEAIANAGAKLLDDDPGKMPALLDLLGEFNVQAITYLREDQLAAFADRLRALGAEV